MNIKYSGLDNFNKNDAEVYPVFTQMKQYILESELIPLNKLIKKKKINIDDFFMIDNKKFNAKIQELCDELKIKE